jgi:NhaP-type Na+/H+ or K+/H+ antiporter
MAHGPLADPALSVAVALAAGMIAQSLAYHLRIPGIVLLLSAGVLLGPDAGGVVWPQTLGRALPALVGFAVAVILFEGSMNLDLRRLRREGRSIRQMVTVGSLVTMLGGAAAARLLLGWSTTLSLLFGTLVIVTGPTVITPLLRRIRVQRNVATVLEAEGVFGDAIGALIAVVALEVTLAPGGAGGGGLLSSGAWGFASRLGAGALVGACGGAAISLLLRSGRLVPEGLENVFTLSCILAVYQASNALRPESGIVSVIVAGLIVGNLNAPALARLKEFKEQLTVMFIGMLFVLLAADVRLADVRHLGWRGLATVAALMFVVRPANVLVGTFRSGLGAREKAFMAWMAPRGIVAAAVSSHFAEALGEVGVQGGVQLRALVFLVIAITVVLQGLTGGIAAHLLGVRRAKSGYLILGANGLGRAYGEALRAAGQEAVFLDSNLDACDALRTDGFRAFHGSALEDGVLARAELDSRVGCLALTANEEVNYLFARNARREWKVDATWAALRRGHLGVGDRLLLDAGIHILFGAARSCDIWAFRLARGTAVVETWRRPPETPPAPPPASAFTAPPDDLELALLPLALRRGNDLLPVDEQTKPQRDDELLAAISLDRAADARRHLIQEGWQPAAIPAPSLHTTDAQTAPTLAGV